jgi:tRNA(Ile)-lysidine synthase TilS/MesJ
VNIRNVVERLGVDHIFFKPDFGILRKIFRASLRRPLYSPKSLERASTVCTSCIGLVKYSALRLALEKGIPLIGFGWSPGQAPVTSSVLQINPSMMRKMAGALKGPLSRIAGKGINAYFPLESHYSGVRPFPAFVHPLEFFDYDEKRIRREIKKLGWKLPEGVDMNATNCLLNPLADIVHIKRYKFHPYAGEIAALVREGYMTRPEGLRHLPVGKDPKVIRMVKNKLGIR